MARDPGRPKGTTEDGPRYDDRFAANVGLYPEDLKRLDVIAKVKGMTRSEAIRYCIERQHYHIAQ
jgi:hypothetical protein